MQKDLAMLASLYCDDYVYWKSEIDIKDNHTRWKYNGKDCCYTLSIAKLLSQIMLAMPATLQNFYQFQQFELVPVVVTTMNRGVKVDIEKKDLLNIQFTELMYSCLDKINYVFNEQINLNSNAQVKRAFKDLLGIKPELNRKTKRDSFGADCMLVYLESYPEWRTILTLFLEYKSIKVFVKNFLSAKVDEDGHMRCDYNPAGTKSYRLGSRKNVFGNGLNLANVPSKGKIDLRIALQELETEEKQITSGDNLLEQEETTNIIEFNTEIGTTYEGTLELPNCKEIFLPNDSSWWFFDADYSAIDLHFVVWESDCKFLKDIIKAGKDVYSILASHYYQREITKKDEERQIFKSICHGSNYLGQAPTLAAKAGLNIHAVNTVIRWYFNQCPEIPEWHRRIENNCRQFGYIENIFGARFECNDFTDGMWLNKMVAVLPQSSAAILVNKAWVTLEREEKGKNIQVLLQTHDSLSGQFKHEDKTATQRIKQYMEIEIPYKDKLIIPAQIKTSPISYGNCK
jgi:DNA polymerase I-like protein with 3'-5' exonuclease and polymerase domains